MYVAAGDGKQDKAAGQGQPAPAAGSVPRAKTETQRSVDEIIQAKKAAAPTKAGNCRLSSLEVMGTGASYEEEENIYSAKQKKHSRP